MAKRRYAYITAAWSDRPWENLEKADRCCRVVFLAGLIPVCPIRNCAGYIDFEVAEEYKAFSDICRAEAKRCPVLVVCGNATDETVMEDIAIARRAGNTVTSLEGLQSYGD